MRNPPMPHAAQGLALWGKSRLRLQAPVAVGLNLPEAWPPREGDRGSPLIRPVVVVDDVGVTADAMKLDQQHFAGARDQPLAGWWRIKEQAHLIAGAREGWLAAIAQWLYAKCPVPVGLDLEADIVLDDERPRAAVLASRRHKHTDLVVRDCLHGKGRLSVVHGSNDRDSDRDALGVLGRDGHGDSVSHTR